MMDEPNPLNVLDVDNLIHDPVTGAYSKALFSSRLHEESARATRELGALSLCLLDIHQNGTLSDHQARDIHAVLKSTLRASDVVFRFSNTEFVLMLPGTIKVDGERTCERLLQALESQQTEGVAVHMGLVTFPEDVLQPEKLLDLLQVRKNAALRSGSGNFVSVGLE
ncbi:GGDEF domain-containing protein [Deinococcus misasensis]|uniref:GGDEF domain-containing protein n=1 Tax=Deinococcus misasensis TaxID=392413 RepID=UPI000554AF6F|nr:GGDEF domain-containing protein [Deinococcus misasensis]